MAVAHATCGVWPAVLALLLVGTSLALDCEQCWVAYEGTCRVSCLNSDVGEDIHFDLVLQIDCADTFKIGSIQPQNELWEDALVASQVPPGDSAQNEIASACVNAVVQEHSDPPIHFSGSTTAKDCTPDAALERAYERRDSVLPFAARYEIWMNQEVLWAGNGNTVCHDDLPRPEWGGFTPGTPTTPSASQSPNPMPSASSAPPSSSATPDAPPPPQQLMCDPPCWTVVQFNCFASCPIGDVLNGYPDGQWHVVVTSIPFACDQSGLASAELVWQQVQSVTNVQCEQYEIVSVEDTVCETSPQENSQAAVQQRARNLHDQLVSTDFSLTGHVLVEGATTVDDVRACPVNEAPAPGTTASPSSTRTPSASPVPSVSACGACIEDAGEACDESTGTCVCDAERGYKECPDAVGLECQQDLCDCVGICPQGSTCTEGVCTCKPELVECLGRYSTELCCRRCELGAVTGNANVGVLGTYYCSTWGDPWVKSWAAGSRPANCHQVGKVTLFHTLLPDGRFLDISARSEYVDATHSWLATHWTELSISGSCIPTYTFKATDLANPVVEPNSEAEVPVRVWVEAHNKVHVTIEYWHTSIDLLSRDAAEVGVKPFLNFHLNAESAVVNDNAHPNFVSARGLCVSVEDHCPSSVLQSDPNVPIQLPSRKRTPGDREGWAAPNGLTWEEADNACATLDHPFYDTCMFDAESWGWKGVADIHRQAAEWAKEDEENMQSIDTAPIVFSADDSGALRLCCSLSSLCMVVLAAMALV